MQVLLHTLRTLQFTCAVINLINDASVTDAYLKQNSIQNFPGIFAACFIIPDVIALLLSGYYILSIEKQWNKCPNKWDFISQSFLLILWAIYAVLKVVSFSNLNLGHSEMLTVQIIKFLTNYESKNTNLFNEVEALTFVGVRTYLVTIVIGFANCLLYLISIFTLTWWSGRLSSRDGMNPPLKNSDSRDRIYNAGAEQIISRNEQSSNMVVNTH